jgi:hypothetical protein
MNIADQPMRALLLLIIAALSAPSYAAETDSPAFERTEQRENCREFTPERRPLFGDLHVQTR